ncbi:hypothetical protein ACFQ02_03285 [Seminibacterium arietis]|uniref:Lipoprotein n=1 Tax=Seminibacterium arietis TaxID=1173502 RepID=A0ABW3I8A5_9PAST
MKLKKSLFIGSIAASAMLLTACDFQKTANNQPVAEQSKSASAETVALNQFNSAVKIVPTMRNLTKDKNGKDAFSLIFKIENISDKAISEIQWFSVAGVDSGIIDISNIPAVFEKPLAAKSTETVTLTKSIESLAETSRPFFMDPKANINVKVLAGKIVFEDKSVIVVTTADDLVKYLNNTTKK